MPFYYDQKDRSSFMISWYQNPRDAFDVFSRGYRKAAENLVSQLLEAPRFSDYEAYPVIFLYRHALETSLKHIIYKSADLAAISLVEEHDHGFLNSHNLLELARTVDRVLGRLYPEDAFLGRVLSVLSTTCLEFAQIDRSSYCYRYPIDKKGAQSTKKDQEVTLRTFATHLSQLLEDLDTLSFGLNAE